MEPCVVTIGSVAKTEFGHKGEELLFVLEGEVEFFLEQREARAETGGQHLFRLPSPPFGKEPGEEEREDADRDLLLQKDMMPGKRT